MHTWTTEKEKIRRYNAVSNLMAERAYKFLIAVPGCEDDDQDESVWDAAEIVDPGTKDLAAAIADQISKLRRAGMCTGRALNPTEKPEIAGEPEREARP